MNLETLATGVIVGTLTVVGFYYLLLLQDRYVAKMRDRFGDGSLRV